MGELWIVLAAVALMALPFVGHWLQKKFSEPGPVTDLCPRCHHGDGLDGGHCADVSEVGGWTQDACTCQNDYHWRRESAREL